MKHIGLNLVVGLALLALLLPFQNCSVYKSKDREDYEKAGPAEVRGGSLSAGQLLELGQPLLNNCHSFINHDQAREILGAQTEFTTFVNPQADLFTCRMTPLEFDPSNVIHYDCRIHRGANWKSLSTQWQDQADIHLSELVTQQPSLTLLDFYAAREGTTDLIQCQVTFTDASQFELNQQKVRKLGTALTQYLVAQ